MSLASHLMILRAQAGLYQWQLAEKSCVSRNTIISIEKGHMTNPRLGTLVDLAKALDIDHKEFTSLLILPDPDKKNP